MNVAGETQAAKAPPSSAHSKVTSSSFDENAKAAEVLTVVGSGPESMVVSGGTPGAGGMTSQVWTIGVGSALPR